MATPESDLVAELSNNAPRVLVVAGAGVACATDPDNNCASWRGMLLNGIQHCQDWCHNLDPHWITATEAMLQSNKVEELISVASRIEMALRKVHDGQFGRWLQESVGNLNLEDDKIIRALLSWNVRIATTNYDNLLENASGLRAVTWRERHLALQVLRGDLPGILHLHGHFLSPDSVVFSSRSYDDVCTDESARNLLRSTFALGTVVFVGCGHGIEDPNFAGLLQWSRNALSQCQHSHYQLVRRAEQRAVAESHEGLPIIPIAYGDHYSELAPFLASIGEQLRSRRDYTEPLASLQRTQADFELQIRQLAEQRASIPDSEFIRRNFELAHTLWRAGGRRSAALHMDSTLSSIFANLPAADRMQYGLETVERLLDDDLDFHAAILLQKLVAQLEKSPVDEGVQLHFREIQARCLVARAAVDEALGAIDNALRLAIGENRMRLQAERAELHMLSGKLNEAMDGALDEGRS
jgi:hypothetical protein